MKCLYAQKKEEHAALGTYLATNDALSGCALGTPLVHPTVKRYQKLHYTLEKLQEFSLARRRLFVGLLDSLPKEP